MHREVGLPGQRHHPKDDQQQGDPPQLYQALKGQKRQFFYLRFFPSEVPIWVPDSHPKIFSSFASSSWSYLN